MKLYDVERAPNPRRVKIFLAEKGIAVPVETMDLMRLDQKSPDFTALNPSQTVPVLVLDDGTAIAESIAICRYFEELHPEPPLFGTGARERALVEMWSRRLEFELMLPIQAAFRHIHPAMAKLEVPQVPDWGEANKPRALAFLRVLDAHLAHHRFICGETFTVPDITGLVSVGFIKLARLAVPDDLVHVKRWYDSVSSRPTAVP